LEVILARNNAIREIRIGRAVSQRKLAKALGINRNMLSYIETGKVLPTFSMLVEIARILNCLVTDLYRADSLEEIKTEVYEKVKR
jgi:DNA-binding XRE family transcriptional regulator